jgi:metallophosphoesterase (TIGR00282 family)
MKKGIRILCVGDVVGPLGCAVFQKHINALKVEHQIDGIIVNGENSSSDGKGITTRIVQFFKHNGADVITSGNHIWAKKDIYNYLTHNKDLLRPANFPSLCPGVGVTTFNAGGYVVGVINLQGRVFMHQHVDCPFKTAESILTYLASKTKIIFVDFHAETTSEKMAMGYYLDGRVSGVVGTHTHVQTADERILPDGTAFITDLGMCGALQSMIGMRIEPIVNNFITQMPHKFIVETEAPALLSGVIIEVDPNTGKALSIERIKIIDETVQLNSSLAD